MRILIVKLSSLGDIIQSLPAISLIKKELPSSHIDWAIEKPYAELLSAYSAIHRTIVLETKRWKENLFSLSGWRRIREEVLKLRQVPYDVIFDLQGNCKSTLVSRLAKGKERVGYSFQSASEWPHSLFMTSRFFIDAREPIFHQYVQLVGKYFAFSLPPSFSLKICLHISKKEEKWIDKQYQNVKKPCFMVAIGSKWESKKLPLQTWKEFLEGISQEIPSFFVFVWGMEEEREEVSFLHSLFPNQSMVLPKMSIPVWHNLMKKMDGILAVDSAALHLAVTASIPTFGIFGSSSSQVYQPIGKEHSSFQGVCTHGSSFVKRCSSLRTCKTKDCMRAIRSKDLLTNFRKWLEENKLCSCR